MGRDFVMIQGKPDRPAVVFIHGLGMDKRIWESPDESRILGGKFPLSLVVGRSQGPEEGTADEQGDITGGLHLGRPAKGLTTLFHSLRQEGCTVITWSQQRPSGGMDVAVSELRDVLAHSDHRTRAGVVLIGHSRGGLVARKYLTRKDERVRCVVTLATPHKGSAMARWGEYLAPAASLISSLLPESERGTALHAVKKVLDFLRSRAVEELLPGSRFFRSLGDSPQRGICYLSSGGSNPTLFTVYRRVIEKVSDDEGERAVVRSRPVFSVPEIFERVIPARLFPKEMKQGKGDGLVSTESSVLPWSDEHYEFSVNHAEILFDERVKRTIVDAVNNL